MKRDNNRLFTNKDFVNKCFLGQCYINGKWCNADNGEVIKITNPATNKVIGTIPKMGQAETKRAINAASEAFPKWQSLTAKERAKILRKWYDLIIQNQRDLSIIMTMEQGKPLVESMGEVAYGASFIEWFAEEGKRIYGEIIPPHIANYRLLVQKQPIGVTAAITPWNFPSAMITRKVAPALAAGCTSIIKPATQTPYSAIALVKLAEEAGVPKGVINLVMGDTNAIGNEITSNPIVRKLSFTGSTEVGKKLIKACASSVKRVSMELGGNAPFIVFDDTDIDEAIKGAIASKYRNSGQTCVCTNRFYIHDAIYNEFVSKFKKEIENLCVGDGLEEGVEQGPLIDIQSVEKIESLLEDAISKGAEIETGGKRHTLGGTFFEPTLVTNVTHQMNFAKEEIFGPVATIFKFNDDDEVVKLSNDTNYGLAAYFYTKDVTRIFKISEQLEYGMVAINTGVLSTELAPFGGIKESGIGREGSHLGIDEYIETKYICLNLP